VSRCRPIVIQHITNIDRHKDPPKDPWDLLAQLLWNDSTDESRSKGTQRSGYGQRFNRDDTLAFLEANGFRTVFRSHQEHTQGIRQEHQDCYTGKRVRQQIIGNMLTNGVFSALAGHAQVVSCPIKAQDELPGATRMRITIHCDLYAGRPRGVIGRVETLMGLGLGRMRALTEEVGRVTSARSSISSSRSQVVCIHCGRDCPQ
jgi:hypothetical protein